MSAVAASSAGVWWIAAAIIAACPRPRVVDVRWWVLVDGRGIRASRPRHVRLDRRVAVAAVVALGVGSVLVVGPLLAAVLCVCVVTAARVIVAARVRRSQAAADRAALATVRMLRGELRAGSGEVAALRAAAAVSGPLRNTVLSAAGLAGTHVADVAAIFDGHDPPSPALAALARAWRVRTDSGASLASVIARVEDELTDRLATRRAVATALAGPRSSAAVLTGLPVVGVLMGAGMGAHPLHFLLDRGAGSAVLLAGAALDAVGVWWTGRLARRASA